MSNLDWKTIREMTSEECNLYFASVERERGRARIVFGSMIAVALFLCVVLLWLEYLLDW